MVKILISRRLFYSLVLVFALFLVSAGVYAFGGTNPSVMGHTFGELKPSCSGIVVSSGIDNSWTCVPNPPACSGTNKVLQWTGSSWNCRSVVI